MAKKLKIILPLLVLAVMAAFLCRVFYFTPEDKIQGIAQKIFYIHAPTAVVMYLAFAVALFSGFAYIFRDKLWLDDLSAASMEVGLLYCTAVLLTGPVWARAAWNVWWTWDPRLTLALFSWFIFLSYFASRSFFGRNRRGQLFSAIFLVFGAVALPLLHFSVKFWRGVHPNVVKGGGLPDSMKLTFLSGIVTMFIVYCYFTWVSFRQRRLRSKNSLLEQ